MELVSLSCNRVFISAESVGRGWCKIVIATKWYQFHTTDKCGFLFMPWITDQYTFVQYTKLVNEIGTAVAKVITFSIMSVTHTQYDMPPRPTPSKNCPRYFMCRIGMASLRSACAAVCRVNKWFADDVLLSVKGEFLPKSNLSCSIDNICWMEWYPSTTKTFLRHPLFQHRALARCWFRREKACVVITGLHARWLVVIVNNGFPVDWSDSG